MKYQEKKYLVDTLTEIQSALVSRHAQKEPEIVSTHYYAQHDGNDVVKLVSFRDKNEIHVLSESQGKYTLNARIPVSDIDAGLSWLKHKGYATVNIVTMSQTDYQYKNGIVGLYVIDGNLCSVILDFPAGKHEEIAAEFGLDPARTIAIPYNKLLESMGKLRSKTL